MGAASTRNNESVPRRPDRVAAIPPLSAPRATGWPSPEYAQPLFPAWSIVLVVALVTAALAAHPSGPAQPVRQALHANPAIMLNLCGPDWRVQRIGGGYSATTIRATEVACALPFGPGLYSLIVHVDGDAALLGLGAGVAYIPMPAGSWWEVDINPGGETLTMQPEPGGGALTVVIQPNRLPRLP